MNLPSLNSDAFQGILPPFPAGTGTTGSKRDEEEVEEEGEPPMSAIDAGVVFVPRFTTLVGDKTFFTVPMDVSRQGGVQFQIWRGPVRTSSGTGSLSVVLQESLDAHTWSQPGNVGPTAGSPTLLLENAPHYFSYTFRLRWFRMGLVLSGTDPIVTCWAEGLLRGGGEGMWGGPRLQPAGAVEARSEKPAPAEPDTKALDMLERLRKLREERMAQEYQDWLNKGAPTAQGDWLARAGQQYDLK
jgi:hypothetical protein